MISSALRQAKSGIQNLPKRRIFDFTDYRQTVFLAGTGRSGTTWVEEIINYDNSFRIMFEPFHSYKIEMLKEWNYRQYLRPENKDAKYISPAKFILSGNIRNPWIDDFNHKLVARKRLIKDIRSQLFLKWIKNNFPEIPIILLLRHPCAVASSKLKLGWDIDLNDFLRQNKLMTDWLYPFEDEILRAVHQDVFDRHIFMWCIENYVPLKQFSKGEALVLFYEDICTNTQPEVERIFDFIRQSYSSRIFEYVSKPSALIQKGSAIVSGASLIDSWRSSISDEQIGRMQEICEIFGMQKIYTSNSSPQIDAESVLDSF